MINKNTFYLCHYCLDSISNYKNDITKHLNKLHKCKPYSILFSFEEASKKSLYTKYIFHIDKNSLTKNDLLIAQNWCNKINGTNIKEKYNTIDNSFYNSKSEYDIIKSNQINDIHKKIINNSRKNRIRSFIRKVTDEIKSGNQEKAKEGVYFNPGRGANGENPS